MPNNKSILVIGIILVIAINFIYYQSQSSKLIAPTQLAQSTDEDDDLELNNKTADASQEIAAKIGIEKCKNDLINPLCSQIQNLDTNHGFYLVDDKIYGLLNYRSINSLYQKVFDNEETIANWIAKLITFEVIKSWQKEKLTSLNIEFFINNDTKYFSIIKAKIDLASFFSEEKNWLDSALNENSNGGSNTKISFTNFQDFVKQQQKLEEQRKKEEQEKKRKKNLKIPHLKIMKPLLYVTMKEMRPSLHQVK